MCCVADTDFHLKGIAAAIALDFDNRARLSEIGGRLDHELTCSEIIGWECRVVEFHIDTVGEGFLERDHAVGIAVVRGCHGSGIERSILMVVIERCRCR